MVPDRFLSRLNGIDTGEMEEVYRAMGLGRQDLGLFHGQPFLEGGSGIAVIPEGTARFIPCWEPNPYLAVEPVLPQEIMLATWDHGDAGPVLAVVSNLHVAESRRVTLEWRGSRALGRVCDARTGEPLAVATGRLTVELGPETFRLLRLE